MDLFFIIFDEGSKVELPNQNKKTKKTELQ